MLWCVARDPGIRLRDIAGRLSMTGRSACGIMLNLAEAGHVLKESSWPCWPAPGPGRLLPGPETPNR